MDDPLRRLPGPIRKIVEEKAGTLGLAPDELAARVWEKERLVPEKHGGVLDRLYAALYGALLELQPTEAKDTFSFGPRKKGEARPRLKDWAIDVFRPSVVVTSSEVLTDGRILEEILTETGPAFLVYLPNPESWEVLREVEFERTTYRPVPVDDKLRNAITLPDGVAEYGSLAELVDEALALTQEQYDPGSKTEQPVWKLWVLNAVASWVAADLFAHSLERFLPILPVIGPSGSGKKRALSMLRGIAYRSLYFLKTTRAPSLYRAIDPWGTIFLILDEADVYDSGEAADFIQFLNSRADGATIPRYSPEKDRNNNFLSFGFTALALRKNYSDTGSISRSIPLSAESTVRDIDLILTNGWGEKARLLRQRLLLWRLRTVVRIRRGEIRIPSRLALTKVKAHRVKEALLVLAALGGEDPRVIGTIQSVGEDLERRLVRQNADSIEGLILNVVYDWLDSGCTAVPDGMGWRLERIVEEAEEGKESVKHNIPLTVKTIVETLGRVFTFSECARWVRGLQFGIHPRAEIGGRRFRAILRILDPARLDRQFERFVVDAEPKQTLFPAVHRQRDLGRSDENVKFPDHAGTSAGQSDQSGHRLSVLTSETGRGGGQNGQSGQATTPHVPKISSSDGGNPPASRPSTDGKTPAGALGRDFSPRAREEPVPGGSEPAGHRTLVEPASSNRSPVDPARSEAATHRALELARAAGSCAESYVRDTLKDEGFTEPERHAALGGMYGSGDVQREPDGRLTWKGDP